MEAKFDLTGESVFTTLPEPTCEEVVDPELTKAILATRDSDPAARGAEQFSGFFHYAPELNYTELYGALQACVPVINLSSGHLQQMERTLLEYFGKFDIKAKYPLVWARIADHFEQVCLGWWEEASGGGRAVHAAAKFDILGLFISKDALRGVESALEAEQDWAPIAPTTRFFYYRFGIRFSDIQN